MSRRSALVLRAFAVWTVWVWGTRIWNILDEADHSVGFKAVHSALALVSVGFAVAAWVIVARVRRTGVRARGEADLAASEDASGLRA